MLARNSKREGLLVISNFGCEGETGDVQWFYLKERLV